MPQQLREFMIDGAHTAAWNGMADALRSRFDVAADGSRTVRRVWLDTFDWRLYRNGSMLEYISGPGVHELALVTADGERIASAVPRMSWPRVADTLPAGLVRELVAADRRDPGAASARREHQRTAHPAGARRRRKDGGPPHG